MVSILNLESSKLCLSHCVLFLGKTLDSYSASLQMDAGTLHENNLTSIPSMKKYMKTPN